MNNLWLYNGYRFPNFPQFRYPNFAYHPTTWSGDLRHTIFMSCQPFINKPRLRPLNWEGTIEKY